MKRKPALELLREFIEIEGAFIMETTCFKSGQRIYMPRQTLKIDLLEAIRRAYELGRDDRQREMYASGARIVEESELRKFETA